MGNPSFTFPKNYFTKYWQESRLVITCTVSLVEEAEERGELNISEERSGGAEPRYPRPSIPKKARKIIGLNDCSVQRPHDLEAAECVCHVGSPDYVRCAKGLQNIKGLDPQSLVVQPPGNHDAICWRGQKGGWRPSSLAACPGGPLGMRGRENERGHQNICSRTGDLSSPSDPFKLLADVKVSRSLHTLHGPQ